MCIVFFPHLLASFAQGGQNFILAQRGKWMIVAHLGEPALKLGPMFSRISIQNHDFDLRLGR